MCQSSIKSWTHNNFMNTVTGRISSDTMILPNIIQLDMSWFDLIRYDSTCTIADLLAYFSLDFFFFVQSNFAHILNHGFKGTHTKFHENHFYAIDFFLFLNLRELWGSFEKWHSLYSIHARLQCESIRTNKSNCFESFVHVYVFV